MSAREIWNGFALINALNARVSGPMPKSVSGISIDSRTIAAGDLFFAIRGDSNDGHEFVRKALENGAAAAVIDEAAFISLQSAGSLLVVEDTFAALQILGQHGRARSNAKIAAVTGSVGKTGTKEALNVVLSHFGDTHASVASYNNHWGVPLTLARMPASTQFGVFEIGMNHIGEITPLVEMVRPHVAIITTIAPVHIQNFKSVDEIVEAKAEIFSGLEPGGAAILNQDNEHFVRLNKLAKEANIKNILTFGANHKSDAWLRGFESLPDGSHIRAEIAGQMFSYYLGAPGRHMAMNSLAVLLTAHSFGLDVQEAAEALRYFHAPQGRGQKTDLATRAGQFTLIDESYNANPTSMSAAFNVLRDTPISGIGRRIAVLGDMLELGPESDDLHRDLAEAISVNNIDIIFCAGPLMQKLFDALPKVKQGVWKQTSSELCPHILDIIRAGDAVMIKGSNGSRMGQIVTALKEQFAPRQNTKGQ